MAFAFLRMGVNPSILKRSSVLALSLGCWATALVPVAWAERPAPDLKAGKAAYLQYCARCHGVEGRGDGVDAKRFYPRPRNFTLGVYKFRSTASGTPPTDEDLFASIAHGLPGTNMPDWPYLDEKTRWQLVNYLKSLAPIFEQTQPAPVEVATDPGSRGAELAHGKVLYEKLGCAACHGASGRANGSSASGLVDDWGMPIRPANLTQGWSYRGGSDPRAVMLRVLTGIDGAGMPSYAGAISPGEAWQLAYYVASLQEPTRWHLIVEAPHVAGTLPSSPDDPRWASADRADVRLRNAVNASGEWTVPSTVKVVSVDALSNDEAIAIRLTWDDPTQDATDRAALLLKPQTSQGDAVTLQAWPYLGGPTLDFCAWSAEAGHAWETLADDFDQVFPGEGSGVGLKSSARYTDARWQMVLQRAFAPGSPEGAATMTLETLTSIAFAAWDGGNPSARAVSPWIEIRLPRRAEPVTAVGAGNAMTAWWIMGIGGAILIVGWTIRRTSKKEEGGTSS